MRVDFYIYGLSSILFLLFYFLFGINFISSVSFLVLLTFCFCGRPQDYNQNETKGTKTYNNDFVDYSKRQHAVNSVKFDFSESLINVHGYHCSISVDDPVTKLFFDTPSIMWKNQSISFSNKSPTKPKAKMKLNTTLPVLTTSPMSTRQRKNLNGSMASGAGPLLSSPILPQIKRALGLEPKSQGKYSLVRRHSLSVPPSLTSTISSSSPAGTVPHVRLNKSRRSSLSDRNSSMLSRSSTVRIAPPTPGKISSPSLYHMRNEVSTPDDRSTPDTFAVVNALKERRKRSITSHEETPDLPIHHAKRRRQESQQSNASTSSLPGPPMPDNLPDLSNPSFALRMETPSLKRPSRPSQDSPGDWDREMEGPVKRQRGELRNNSILSSLSSSRRFAERQSLERSQSMKRKAERSFVGKENETSQTKLPKTDTMALRKADTICVSELVRKRPEEPQSKETVTNGHTDKEEEIPASSEASQTPTKPKLGVPTLKSIPSMKKSATVYSGLASKGSFTKAHYANIVATAEDYDSDRETEQKRVKQMLQDLDESFSKDEAKAAGLTTDSATSTISTATTSVPPITITTSTISIATTAITVATSSQPSILSTLSQPPKSPIQETGVVQESSASAKSEASSSATAPTTTTGAQSPKFKPLFGPVSTADSTTSASEGKPAAFSFGLNTATASSTTAPVIGQSATSSGQPSSLGAPPPYSFGTLTSVTSVGGTTTTVTNVLSNASSSATSTLSSNFGFGLNQTKTDSATSQSALPVNLTSTTAPSGFAFAAGQAPAASSGVSVLPGTNTQPGLSSNFSFGKSAAPTTTSAASAGFAFGQTSSAATGSSSGGFGFGQTPSTTTATAGGLSFGQTTSQPSFTGVNFGQSPAATKAQSTSGFAFGQTLSVTTTAAGFSFGQGTVTSSSSAAAPSAPAFAFGQTASTGAAGFSFGQTSTTTTASAGGFSFGTGLSTTKPSAATNLFPAVSTSAPTASGFAFGASTSGSTPAFGSTSAPTQPQTGFAFGSSAGSSTPAFSFGATQPTTTSAPSQPLQFGANTTTVSSGFSFGAGTTGTSQSTPFGIAPSSGPSFGAAATTAPAFGAPSGSSTFAFGAGSSGVGATATPFQSNTPATSTGGFAFGQNAGATGSAFAFGTKSASTPAFGAAFGSSTQTGSVFGGTGTGVKPTSAFGQSHSQSNTPTFGSSTNPAPAFGPKSLTPTFGSSTNNNAGFSFSQQPAPNVNPFGQTTPAKQTGSAFGQTGLAATPQQQTGSVFQFGQSGSQQPSAVKGFDFSSAAGGTGGNSGFSFSAGGTPGGFGTPSMTPTGTPTPAGFSMGSAPRPQRTMSKARRRTTRK